MSADEWVRAIWGLLKRIVFWAAVIVGTVYLLYRLRSVIAAVLAAVLLTYALLPGVDWLSKRIRPQAMRHRTRRLIATIIIFIIFLGIVSLSIGLMIEPFKREITDFKDKVTVYTSRLANLTQKAISWYTKKVPPNIKDMIEKMDYLRVTSSVAGYVQRILKFATSSIGILLELVLIPVLAFYFLFDYKTLTGEVYGLVPPGRRREALKIGRSVGEILQNYIFGQAILCAVAGLLTGIFLAALSVPYVVVLALFAAITRAIPVIGPVVSGIPIVLVGIVSSHGPALPLTLLGFVIVMHFAESKFIMPHLLGERLKLHPATVIIVLLIGAEFFGIVGMFLAAPVAAIVRELVRLYYIRPSARST